MNPNSNTNSTPSYRPNHTIDDAIDLISQSVSEMILDTTKQTKKFGQSNSNTQSDITLNSNDSLSMQSFDNARQRGIHSKSPPSPCNTVSTRDNSMPVNSSGMYIFVVYFKQKEKNKTTHNEPFPKISSLHIFFFCFFFCFYFCLAMGYSSQPQQAPHSQVSFPTCAVARGANQRPSDIGYRQRLFIESTSGGASMFINKKNSSGDIDGGKKSKRGAKDGVSKFSSSVGLSNVSNIKHHQSNTNINDLSIDFSIGDSHSQNVNAHSNSNNSSVTLFGGISGSGHSFNVKNLHTNTNTNTTKNTNTKANATNSDSFSIDYRSYSSIDSNDTNKTLVGGKKSKIGKKTDSSVSLSKISNLSNVNTHSNDLSIYFGDSYNANKNVEYDDLSADLAGLNNLTNTNVNANANVVSNDSTDMLFGGTLGSGQSNTNKNANTTNTDSNSLLLILVTLFLHRMRSGCRYIDSGLVCVVSKSQASKIFKLVLKRFVTYFEGLIRWPSPEEEARCRRKLRKV